MQEVLSGVNQLFINDEANIIKIANGVLPNDYNNMGDNLPILISQGYYGTSKTTFSSCAIWYVYFALNNVNINAIDIFNSAITHVIAIPPNYSCY